ncbi:MAG: hypothetical protein ACYDA8_10165 [Deferrisomatales bacterium]
MNFANDFGAQAIKDVVEQHPAVGAILDRHGIACVTCGVGICHLKDVVSIHGLPPEEEAEIEREINQYLETR